MKIKKTYLEVISFVNVATNYLNKQPKETETNGQGRQMTILATAKLIVIGLGLYLLTKKCSVGPAKAYAGRNTIVRIIMQLMR